MELLRRLILLICVCAAIWLAYLADLSPKITVMPVDFAGKWKQLVKHTRTKNSLIAADEKESSRPLTLQEYIAQKTKGNLRTVQGREWDDFFSNVIAAAKGRKVSKEWKKHASPDMERVLFFLPDEQILSSFRDNFQKKGDELYLAFQGDKQTEYLEVQYRTYSYDDFRLGSGFSPYPDPPSYLLYPYRKYSLWIIATGLAMFLFLPGKKKYPEALQYPKWRVILGDVFSFLLIVPFFSLPILAIQGSMQIFSEAWFLIAFSWPNFLLGIYALKISAWFASYELMIKEDSLRLSTYKGIREYRYSDMLYFQPVTFKAPRWLIILSWIAALSGKGAARIGGIGRAMILSSSEAGSIGIAFKDKTYMYINITDQMGNTSFPGAEKILKAFKKAGVKENEEHRVVRSLGFETVGFSKTDPGK